MKIIFPTIAYSPDGGSIYNDLVDCLVTHGHEIVVCRSDPSIDHTTLKTIRPGIKILNIKTGNQFEHNLIKKGINMLLLERQFISGIKKYLHDDRFDLVLYATPPISLNGVVKFCKKVFKARSFLMLKDIFPQNAIDLEMIKPNSIIHKYFLRKETNLYEISDYIGCMSNKNLEYLMNYDDSIQQKGHIFFNSIKVADNRPIFDEEKKTTDFVFGGNLGKPQNIPLLLKMIDQLKDYPLARFTIVGKGSEDHLVKKYAKENNSNFTYVPYLPKEAYDSLLLNCDIGLICLDPRFTIANIPSKLPTYYNYGKPVLAITDTSTDLKDFIEPPKCGWWCDANNTKEIITTIKEICSTKAEQHRRAINAKHYVKKHFDVERNVKQIENFMEGLSDE